jgi:hypothetical protein
MILAALAMVTCDTIVLAVVLQVAPLLQQRARWAEQNQAYVLYGAVIVG